MGSIVSYAHSQPLLLWGQVQKKSANEIVTVADQERNNKPDTCGKELVVCIYLRHPLTKQPYVPSTTMSKFSTVKIVH